MKRGETSDFDDAGTLGSLEHALALSPQNSGLWHRYETLLIQKYGNDPPEETFLARQFLKCLESDLGDPQSLNQLAAFYENKGQHFNAMLCRLASLSANPGQSGIYGAAKRAYNRGIFSPPPFVPTEPVTCTVSVILATHNRPTSLRLAIESVLEQTLQDFELLVINDGGTEEARAVADSFGSPKMRYFSKEQGGHRSAMNLGLRVARGKYIAYLDDDDVYFPQHLQTVVEAAETGHLDFVCSRNRWVVGRWEEGRWLETDDLTKQEPFDLKRLHISAVIPDLTVLHTRSLAERVGLFWEDPPRGGEWEYWVRCSHYVPIKRLDAITGEVRVRSIVPLNQPARSQFYTQLWRIYFGSAFGEAVLAIAAGQNGNEEEFRQHVKRIDGFWPFLNRRCRELLWDVGLSCRGIRGREILSKLAEKHPTWVGLKFREQLKTGGRWRLLARFPLTAYWRLGRYVLENPGSLFPALWGFPVSMDTLR